MSRLFKKLILVMFIPISVMLFNHTIDPLQIYSRSQVYAPEFSGDMRYQAAGLIKNYDYDTIIVGSASVVDFSLRELRDDYKIKAIRLAADYPSIAEEQQILKLALAENSKIKRIIWEIRSEVLALDENNLPMYLYDKNPLNDYKYLLNPAITRQSANIILRHEWYNSEETLTEMNNLGNELQKCNFREYNGDDIMADIKKNTDAMMEFALEYPNVEFYCFFPDVSQEDGNLQQEIEAREYIYSRYALGYNIKIYDFVRQKNALNASGALRVLLTETATTQKTFSDSQSYLKSLL